jgi:hypothetical protein
MTRFANEASAIRPKLIAAEVGWLLLRTHHYRPRSRRAADLLMGDWMRMRRRISAADASRCRLLMMGYLISSEAVALPPAHADTISALRNQLPTRLQ